MADNFDLQRTENNLLDRVKKLEDLVNSILANNIEIVDVGDVTDPLETVNTTVYFEAIISIDPATDIVMLAPLGGSRISCRIDDTWTAQILSAAVTYDASGLTKDRYIDWYAYPDGDTVALYASVWTNDTTRSEAQTSISGYAVLASNTTYRFVTIGRIPTVGDPTIGGNGDMTWAGGASGVMGNLYALADTTGKNAVDSGYKPSDFAASAHVTTHLDGGSDTLITISAAEPIAPAGGFFWVDTA